MIELRCRIHRPFYDWDGRKYLELEIDGRLVQVKVPFRYNRVMCRMSGLRTIHEFKKDEIIDALLEKKIWDGHTYWIVHGVREVPPEVLNDRGI
jgi:hypothetical protein